MFEKNMKVAYLLDFYADALDSHIGNVMRSYYDDDLSLSEIANGVGISRQGIRHLIKKGEEQLLFFEEKFGLAKRYEELNTVVVSLSDIQKKLSENKAYTEEANELSNLIEIITKGNTDVPESN